MKHRLTFCALSLVLVARIPAAAAQEPTYEEVEAKFAGTAYAQWKAAGYEKDPFCYDGSEYGHPEWGGLGFAAFNAPLLVDDTLDPLHPEGLWLNAEDQVIGVAYIAPSRETDTPELFGHPFVPTPGNKDYSGLNVWFVGAPENRFEPYNPAVTCPPGTAYTAGTGTSSQPLSQGQALLIWIVLLGLAVSVALLRQSAKLRGMDAASIAHRTEAAIASVSTASRRLMSVDALRGFDMFWIAGGETIIHSLRNVTSAGLVRTLDTQFTHRDWEGATFYDLIFPLFVFIVGASLVFSLSRVVQVDGKKKACKRILRRSAFLFAIGVLFSSGPITSLEGIRLMGVLQRIALCYLVAGLLFSTLKPRSLVIVCVALLVVYWALMTFVPVPGAGAGSFQEGTNLANYIDQQYLPLTKYDGDHDPEGLLSTLPAIATCLLGVFAGILLNNGAIPARKKVRILLVSGVTGILLGSLWGMQFPVIKKIWTSSYVLVTGGWSAILLGAFYQVIEVWRFRKWASPFVWIGMNSIAIYLVSGFLAVPLLYMGLLTDQMVGVFGPYGELATSLAFVGLILLIAYLLHRRKVFLRV